MYSTNSDLDSLEGSIDVCRLRPSCDYSAQSAILLTFDSKTATSRSMEGPELYAYSHTGTVEGTGPGTISTATLLSRHDTD